MVKRLWTLAALAALALPAVAATAPPYVSSSPPPLPKKALHAEVLVRTNGKGEAAGVKMRRLSGNHDFDFVALRNAAQIMIHTDRGKVVVGTFDVSYDYDPKTHATHRSVRFVSRGGNPNAPGIAEKMMKDELRRQVEWDMNRPSPSPKPSSH